MNIQTLKTQYLPVWCLSHERGQPSLSQHAPRACHRVVILGNAYGVMPYQQPLAEHMTRAGFDACWAPLRGQRESFGGLFSIRGAASDIADIVEVLRQRFGDGDRISLVGHCASSLAILEYLRATQGAGIESAILYSPLTNRRRMANGAARLHSAGVRHDLSVLDLDYSAVVAARGLATPLLLVEATDEINRRRTSRSDLIDIQSAARGASLIDIGDGYDGSADKLAAAAELYVDWLRSVELPARKPELVLTTAIA